MSAGRGHQEINERHEITNSKDKLEAIREALRVVKKVENSPSKTSFYSGRYTMTLTKLVETIRSLGNSKSGVR